MSKFSVTGPGLWCVGGKRSKDQISHFERRLEPQKEEKTARAKRRALSVKDLPTKEASAR